jgi:hypothetical protein
MDRDPYDPSCQWRANDAAIVSLSGLLLKVKVDKAPPVVSRRIISTHHWQ